MPLTVEDVRGHLRFEHTEEDVQIGQYLRAAESYLSAIGVDLEADPRPAAIDQAILLIVGEFFDGPRIAEPMQPSKALSSTVDRLIAPFREVTL